MDGFYNVFCRLWQFACGIIAYCFVHKQKHGGYEKESYINDGGSNSEEDNKHSKNMETILVMVFLGPLFIPFYNEQLLRVHAVATTMVLLIYGDRHKIEFLCHPFIVYIGDISYVLYLIHWPIYILARYAWSESFGAPVALILSFPAAALICKYFEKPYMEWKPLHISLLLTATGFLTAFLVHRPVSSDYSFPNADFNYTGVNVSDASWNHTLMQQLAYHESVRWETTMKNLATPGCKYSTRFVGSNIEPFGLCELEHGTGNLSVLVIGNSFACNQADMVYRAFKRISSTFHVFCLNGCEVLSTTPEEKCKVKVNYEEIYEQLKPNLLFVLDRSFEAKTRVIDCHACNSDTLYMQQLYNLVLMENYADKVFILEAMPSCELSCATLALDFMVTRNKPLREMGTFLITKDDEYARIRHEELRKRCRKCELIDYVPALSDKDGVYRGYDPETNIMYLDESNHLNKFGKERLQPLFDDLAERTEKDFRA
ncbi:hypothetical protein Q1695_004642 [Nippostrongylus brasiliensis]|nr:hypothetical protein Q1695_004642 [Nippostrongylus brasiliensis]